MAILIVGLLSASRTSRNLAGQLKFQVLQVPRKRASSTPTTGRCDRGVVHSPRSPHLQIYQWHRPSARQCHSPVNSDMSFTNQTWILKNSPIWFNDVPIKHGDVQVFPCFPMFSDYQRLQQQQRLVPQTENAR